MVLLVGSSTDLWEVPETKSSPSIATLRLSDLAGPLGLPLPFGVGGPGLLGPCHRLCSGSPAPSPEGAKTLTLGAESPLFIDRPDFFDYPDSDQARLLALAQFIGEKPVNFVNSGMKQLEKGSPPRRCLKESPFPPFLVQQIPTPGSSIISWWALW